MLVEVACDESGSEGENLIGGETDVFAHASVRMDPATAARHVQAIRDRIGSPAQEIKSGHLLREKSRRVLVWLLEPGGPLLGAAHVFLVDKEFYVVGRVIEVLVDDPVAPDLAATLYRAGGAGFGFSRWQAFLRAANALLRAGHRAGVPTPVEAFFRTVDGLHPVQGRLAQIVARLRAARPRAEEFRARPVPTLDPLIPAIARAIGHWSNGGAQVALVHDQHPGLTARRVAALHRTLPLRTLTQVDSRTDPRVQLADFLAGVARKIASDDRGGRADAELSVLLRPYVDAQSVWDGY